jgi:hypothetical protein
LKPRKVIASQLEICSSVRRTFKSKDTETALQLAEEYNEFQTTLIRIALPVPWYSRFAEDGTENSNQYQPVPIAITRMHRTSFVLMAVVFYFSVTIFSVGCINGDCSDVLNYSRMRNNSVYSF